MGFPSINNWPFSFVSKGQSIFSVTQIMMTLTLKLKRVEFSHCQIQRKVNRMYYVTVVAAQIRSCWVSDAAVQVVAALLLLWPRWKNTGQPSVSCQDFPFSKYMSDGIWHLTIDEERLKQKIAVNFCHDKSAWSFCLKQCVLTKAIQVASISCYRPTYRAGWGQMSCVLEIRS